MSRIRTTYVMLTTMLILMSICITACGKGGSRYSDAYGDDPQAEEYIYEDDRDSNIDEEAVGESDYATTDAVSQATNTLFDWRPLKEYCVQHGLKIEKVRSDQWGYVNSYPAAAWQAVYSVDISNLKSYTLPAPVEQPVMTIDENTIPNPYVKQPIQDKQKEQLEHDIEQLRVMKAVQSAKTNLYYDPKYEEIVDAEIRKDPLCRPYNPATDMPAPSYCRDVKILGVAGTDKSAE
ncbi:hypothetical protein [Acinetobacter baumannii]|uniref:hypothetical protein n=1 Tax=Acinetobacter baumannii TaxID=470 RepID=UPI0038B4211B